MKVLWFTNTILPDFADAISVSGSDYGGWMPSLLSAIRTYAPQVELHVASQGPAGKTAEVGGVHYYALGMTRLSRGVRVLGPDFERLARETIGNVRPDVIHVHGSEGPFADFSSETWKAQRVAVSLQGIINACYRYYYGNLVESDYRPFRNRVREVLKGHSELVSREYWKTGRSRSESRLLGCASMLLGRTDWDRAWASYLVQNKPYRHVNELLREPFYKVRRDESLVRPHSIYCGAAFVSALKNGHVLLEAVARLRMKYPDLVLHVANAAQIGKTPSFVERLREGEYVRYVRDMVTRLGLMENLVLHPSLSGEKVRDVLARTEVFCLPSACENSPNSLCEAMLVGTPSIATYVGGTPSMLRNGEEGLLVPSGDPAAFVAAIDRFFTDRQFARQCADKAYETACVRHDPQTVVSQLLDAYEELVST